MKTLPLWITSFVLISCCASKESTNDVSPDGFTVIGTMKYLAIESGCWQFTADNGTAYQLSGALAERLQHDGQRAEVIVRESSNRRTICMTGESVELLKIIKIY